MNDLYLFSEENLLKQLEASEFTIGFYKVKFYTVNGIISTEPTSEVSDFYLYPSGGTLRDAKMNIVFYSTKFDTYKGFKPPHLN